MANPTSNPLYDKISFKNNVQRAADILILSLLICLLIYRLVYRDDHGFAWQLAFICESWFTFNWLLVLSTKWSPVEYKTYPERLPQAIHELPSVDMFVTTADAELEPPIITINTVLSLLALDYPADKLACYVSDDGCSPLTYYSLIEASKFAKVWVPFCKKYDIQVRAPFRYFSTEPTLSSNEDCLEFLQEWKLMKDEYEQLCSRIKDAARESFPCDAADDFVVFSNIDKKNHPTIIKVIWENKEGLTEGVPHLVYIAREKRPMNPHHYKGGAMNVLVRVSGLMTNAPFLLNVDCDMYVNNPKIVLHAMCLLLGNKYETEFAFIQCPQLFYDGIKDDPFGTQVIIPQKYLGRGMMEVQGPPYGGTGCFHRRKVIYGSTPQDHVSNETNPSKFKETFGNSVDLIKSACDALNGRTKIARSLSSSIMEAYKVATSDYEHGNGWGTKVGLMYGSATEDVLTGLTIHKKGWKSAYCWIEPPAFLGCAPPSGPSTMTQQKRWASGLLEIFLSRNCPFLATITGRLQLRQCLSYSIFLLWGLRSIFELCYAALPPYCIITNTNILPKVDQPSFLILVALFIIYNICTCVEYIKVGLSIRAWWNNQRMTRMKTMTVWLFSLINVTLKLLGLSEVVFDITQKEQSSSSEDTYNDNAGKFTFDDSPYFLLGTTILLVQLTALFVGALELMKSGHLKSGFGEFFCSIWVVMSFWPFVKGLFRKGKYGLPLKTISKSSAFAILFYHLCKLC